MDEDLTLYPGIEKSQIKITNYSIHFLWCPIKTFHEWRDGKPTAKGEKWTEWIHERDIFVPNCLKNCLSVLSLIDQSIHKTSNKNVQMAWKRSSKGAYEFINNTRHLLYKVHLNTYIHRPCLQNTPWTYEPAKIHHRNSSTFTNIISATVIVEPLTVTVFLPLSWSVLIISIKEFPKECKLKASKGRFRSCNEGKQEED